MNSTKAFFASLFIGAASMAFGTDYYLMFGLTTPAWDNLPASEKTGDRASGNNSNYAADANNWYTTSDVATAVRASKSPRTDSTANVFFNDYYTSETVWQEKAGNNNYDFLQLEQMEEGRGVRKMVNSMHNGGNSFSVANLTQNFTNAMFTSATFTLNTADNRSEDITRNNFTVSDTVTLNGAKNLEIIGMADAVTNGTLKYGSRALVDIGQVVINANAFRIHNYIQEIRLGVTKNEDGTYSVTTGKKSQNKSTLTLGSTNYNSASYDMPNVYIGDIVNEEGATVNLNGYNQNLIGTFENNGTTVVEKAANFILTKSGSFINNGTIKFAGGDNHSQFGSFTNNGTFSFGAVSTTFNYTVEEDALFESKGLLSIGQGNFTVKGTAIVDETIADGKATAKSSFASSGGTVDVYGTLALKSGGKEKAVQDRDGVTTDQDKDYNTIKFSNNSTLNVRNSGNLNVTGGVTFEKTAVNIEEGANFLVGTETIDGIKSAGTVLFGSGSSLTMRGTMTQNGGATVRFNAGNHTIYGTFNQNAIDHFNGGNVVLESGATWNQKAQISINTGSLTLNEGSTFNSNSYLTVGSAGTLNINNSTTATSTIKLSTGGVLNVNSGGALVIKGNLQDELNAGATKELTVNVAGRLQIDGNMTFNKSTAESFASKVNISGGVFAIKGAATFGGYSVVDFASGKFEFDVGSGSSLLFSGNASLIGDILASDFAFANYEDGQTYELIFFDDSSKYNASLTALKGTSVDYNGYKVTFGGDDNAFTATFEVPEPSTWAAIFGALALAFAIYRRRK